MYNYACIEMNNVNNATFPLVLHGTIAKSRIEENINNVMSQLVEPNFVCLLVSSPEPSGSQGELIGWP